MKREEILKSLMTLFHGLRCLAHGTKEFLDATEFLSWAKNKRRLLLARASRPTTGLVRDY